MARIEGTEIDQTSLQTFSKERQNKTQTHIIPLIRDDQIKIISSKKLLQKTLIYFESVVQNIYTKSRAAPAQWNTCISKYCVADMRHITELRSFWRQDEPILYINNRISGMRRWRYFCNIVNENFLLCTPQIWSKVSWEITFWRVKGWPFRQLKDLETFRKQRAVQRGKRYNEKRFKQI